MIIYIKESCAKNCPFTNKKELERMNNIVHKYKQDSNQLNQKTDNELNYSVQNGGDAAYSSA